MATTVLGLKTFTASDPVDYNEINDNYNKIDNGVKTALQGRAAHNLLDNSDFTNPVNQRGATSYSTQWAYTIDRWYLPGSTVPVTVSEGYVSFCVADQFTGKAITNGDYTVVVKLLDGRIFFGSAYYTAGESVAMIANNGVIDCYLMGDAGSSAHPRLRIQTVSGEAISFVWAALYEGSYTADTLPAYQPKGYAAELAEAQRYYIHDMGRFTQGIIMPSGVLRVSYPVPTTMRTNPTVIVNNLDNAVVFSNGYSTVIGLTACSFNNKKDNAILVDFSTNINAGDYKYCVATTYATSISLSCDL